MGCRRHRRGRGGHDVRRRRRRSAAARCWCWNPAKAPGEKIRISGGGRCNFTNLRASPAQFLSANPHFCISALSRYTQQDFIALVTRHRIGWHEKTLGQLFCDGSAGQIIDMLLDEMARAGVQLRLKAKVQYVEKTDGRLQPADR